MSTIDHSSFPLRVWDSGLVNQVLEKNHLFPRLTLPVHIEPAQSHNAAVTTPRSKLSVGTFSGTSKAMTDVYHGIEDRYRSFFDVIGVSSSLPLTSSLEEKQRIYQWSVPNGPNGEKFPPHLALIPPNTGPDDLPINKIYDAMRLQDTGFVLSSIIPDEVKDFIYSHPDRGATMNDIDKRNRALRAEKKNILAEPNVGDREITKWYTDEVFAQQQFTGTNPVTIERATEKWAAEFERAATSQGDTDMASLVSSAAKDASLYIQDCSYFREAVGAPPDAEMKATVTDGKGRYASATVTLYHLTPAGKLHPLAIVVDYKVSMSASVVIFNKRLNPNVSLDQSTDWPWRYAKTAAQSADWIRHECAVHLTNTHLAEEATIVAAHRTLPTNHLVYLCLQPHWLKTLPINASARTSLVPPVIVPLIGLTEDQTYAFLRDAYKRFDWQGNYVPTDLARRGFPLEALLDPTDQRYRNYAYGKDILLMWRVLHKFVSTYLHNDGNGYTTDADVSSDPHIAAFCAEMRSESGGQMTTFPEIRTLAQLVDAVTMCIHLAAPQHSAVNYLQEYYQSFVPNKPPALCMPLPTTLEELEAYGEKDLMHSLPINRPREWLLASHLVHLLNSRVADDQNPLNYGISLYHLAHLDGAVGIQEAARGLVEDLRGLGDRVEDGVVVEGALTRVSRGMDDQEVPYRVLDPGAQAVSILI